MTEATSLFSPHWYRIANIKPCLRGHIEVTRHKLRGEIWYFLRDQITGQHHRFNSSAYFLIGQFDGKKTMQDIWSEAVETLNEKTPSQDHCIDILSGLYQSDLLITGRGVYYQEQYNRQKKTEIYTLENEIIESVINKVTTH